MPLYNCLNDEIFLKILFLQGDEQIMLEATFSPLIPSENSNNFYIEFYNSYSFFQVNDLLFSFLSEKLNEDEIKYFIDCLDNYSGDQLICEDYTLGMGIINPSLIRRSKEKRGLSVESFKALAEMNVNPFEWYQNSHEFLMLYVNCEQAIRSYLVSNNIDSTSIKESNILEKMFTTLHEQSHQKKFFQEISEATSDIFENKNQLGPVWAYFTLYRHTLAHSGGRSTDKIKDTMDKTLENHKNIFSEMNSDMLIELPKEIQNFFFNPFEDMFLTIPHTHLNFFRNMTLAIVESLERAINPKPYKIEDFDPYKL